MSGLLGSNVNVGVVLGCGSNGNDDSLQPVDYKTVATLAPPWSPPDMDVLWPRSSFTGQDYTNMPMIWEPMHQAWEWNILTTGVRVRKKVIGVTKDGSGVVLGGCTVQLFNTATGTLVDTQVSDSAGNYTLTDPNNVACFVVGYLPGSPDVAGTTVNTVTGT
jgi:hypothetical protein